MSDEATIRVSVQIRNTTTGFQYQSGPTSFSANVASCRGPSPGILSVPAAPSPATVVDLSKLTQAGITTIQNLSTLYKIQVGLSDGTNFRPMDDVLPGEIWPRRLSSSLGKDENSGTGSTSPPERLALRAVGGTCDIIVNAFDS